MYRHNWICGLLWFNQSSKTGRADVSQSPDEGSGEQEWRRLGEKLEGPFVPWASLFGWLVGIRHPGPKMRTKANPSKA